MFLTLASGQRNHDSVHADGRKTAAWCPRPILVNTLVWALMATALAGCYKRSVMPQSEGHLATPAAKPSLADVPPTARTSDFVPAPKPTIKPPIYSVVVNEVPVKELLLALARDTKQNIDIHPALTGLVSLNAINESLPAILERMSKQVDLRFHKEGNTIVVTPDTPYTKTYRIDYVNMVRNSNSITSVSGRIGSGAQSSGQPGGQTATQQQSTTSVTTTTANDFWKMLETSLRGILTSSKRLTKEEKADQIENYKQEQKIRIEEAIANRIASGARSIPASGSGATDTSIRLAASAGTNLSAVSDDVIVNPISGTVTINGNELQHNLIQAYLDTVQRSAQRQVLIEATIVEVTLSDQYQAGIDWSRLAVSGGITLQQSLLAGNLGTPPNFAIGYVNPTSTIGNIAASVKLLDQFGNARVLSSPKLMAMNNQTALLKVVDDVVYFTITAQPAIVLTGSAAAQQATFTTTPQTLEVGVVMSLTPQINENGRVILGVRPSITRLLGFINDPNPVLANPCPLTPSACTPVVSKIPQTQKREMESVLQLTSGQTAVLGGFMQDTTQYNRNSVPGAGNPVNTGFFSELFGYREDKITKSELVIFLRPTIITNPSLESEGLQAFQRLLPKQTDTPTETQPGETAGARR